MKIGVLALQGDFAEHVRILDRIGVTPVEIRLPGDMADVDGLIIPGGESTTIGKLAVRFGLMEPIRQLASNKPVWGTCAGAIFLARDPRHTQPMLGLMDISVRRNAFGRQAESFETDLEIPDIVTVENSRSVHAVFIRAPLIESVGPDVKVLARLTDGRIVAARQRNLLATAFHPELTGDDRFHRYFLALGSR
ncbi:MAG: pyridoxal 5'-phosphate synthase glutaminase subunit PdxT [Desulfatirhabdiaceae bacterium]|nr:pyridoxal 5'-phosphate synthase glutaminase subunit PdxT [Desulfatirhabdiaceae bacterium]